MTTSTRDWQLVSEKRAMVYHWLSGLFAQELNDEQFNFYQAGKADEWLSGLAHIGLEREVKQVKAAIAQWLSRKIDAIDLRADFAGLFLLDGKVAAPPYASVYLDKDGQMFGEMESRMRYFLSHNRLELSADFKEPADHLAVYLALLSTWTSNCLDNNNIDKIANEQLHFIQQALLSWLPQFVKQCQSIAADSDFYAALTSLLLAFVYADVEYLQQL